MSLDGMVLHPTPDDVPNSTERGIGLHSKGIGMCGRYPEPYKHMG